jgi:AraC family transcriptional regulator of adaptative response / DNA-3-methyladenine glycosylase II
VDFEVMYRAMDSRDRRFDGRFFVAVTSTRIYCRPICPAPTPMRKNTRFYRYAAVAELAGFRPCKRCRPEASPDAPEWDIRADLVGRVLRLIADGAIDRIGVAGVAHRVGVSERHLQRVFKTEVGATPGAIARSRRARLARQLLAETSLPITRVAFAAGFSSVRAFNETVRQIYRVTPTELRRGRPSANGALELELSFRPPLATTELFAFLNARAIPGVEEVTEASYRRAVRFGEHGAVVTLRPSAHSFTLTLDADEVGSLAPVVQRARQLLDLDADPDVIDERLSESAVLRPLVGRRPGIRLAGAFDSFELAVSATLQQGSSPNKASEMAGRIATTYGRPLRRPVGSVTHLFPTSSQIADVDLTAIDVSPRAAAAIGGLARGHRDGHLAIDGTVDVGTSMKQLLAVPGIGPRTAALIGMSALRDPDAYPATDAGLRRALATLSSRSVVAVDQTPDRWRPWRGYAAMHLWAEQQMAQAKPG